MPVKEESSDRHSAGAKNGIRKWEGHDHGKRRCVAWPSFGFRAAKTITGQAMLTPHHSQLNPEAIGIPLK